MKNTRLAVGAVGVCLLLAAALCLSCSKKEPEPAAKSEPKAVTGGESSPAPETKKREPETMRPGSVEKDILIYLGSKPGSPRIRNICGVDLRGKGAGAGEKGSDFEKAFAPGDAVKVAGKVGESATVTCRDGTTVEYFDDTVVVMKEGKWVDPVTGKELAPARTTPVNLQQ
jgi:hypothetical protein